MKLFLLSLYILLLSFGLCSANVYPWTDLSGRTLQAKFLQVGGSAVTIEINGQPFDIPLDTLSAESKALATM